MRAILAGLSMVSSLMRWIGSRRREICTWQIKTELWNTYSPYEQIGLDEVDGEDMLSIWLFIYS